VANELHAEEIKELKAIVATLASRDNENGGVAIAVADATPNRMIFEAERRGSGRPRRKMCSGRRTQTPDQQTASGHFDPDRNSHNNSRRSSSRRKRYSSQQ
jgi:hypothetical protein